jgi:threonine aldolase
MRQIGLLSGCIAYALNHNFPRLSHVHVLARRLEAGLREIGVRILGGGTCMVCRSTSSRSFLTRVTQVFFDPTPLGIEYEELSERAETLPEPMTITSSRLVVHIQTEDRAVDDLLTLVKTIAEEKRAAGFVTPLTGGKSPTPENIYREIDRRFKPQPQ